MSRIYVVQIKGSPPRLIDAITPAQAIRYVATGLITAKVASARDAALLMKAGTPLETAGEIREEETTEATEG